MNILDYSFGSLQTIFWVKYLILRRRSGPGIFLTLDLGSGMEKFGSGINIPDPATLPETHRKDYRTTKSHGKRVSGTALLPRIWTASKKFDNHTEYHLLENDKPPNCLEKLIVP
jgi:hypothetical protein